MGARTSRGCRLRAPVARASRLAWVLAPALAAVPGVAHAHGAVTGIEDVWQDYGLAVFLALVLVVGAGVLLWVLLAPLPDDPAASGADPLAASDLDEARGIDHEDRRAT